jgi:hypothetical protein
MRPYVLDERHAKHVDTRYMTPQQRRATPCHRTRKAGQRDWLKWSEATVKVMYVAGMGVVE